MYQHLNKGAAIDFQEETQEVSDVIAIAYFEHAAEDAFKLPRPFDLNPELPEGKRKKSDLISSLQRVFFVKLKSTSDTGSEAPNYNRRCRPTYPTVT